MVKSPLWDALSTLRLGTELSLSLAALSALRRTLKPPRRRRRTSPLSQLLTTLTLAMVSTRLLPLKSVLTDRSLPTVARVAAMIAAAVVVDMVAEARARAVPTAVVMAGDRFA